MQGSAEPVRSDTVRFGPNAPVPAADVEPVYFGRDGMPLFGCYHAAQAPRREGAVLVICQPFGQEYIRCHRLLRLLAASLARAGLPVLRFDYRGCGDSTGDTESATLARCIEDLGEAVRFARGRARALSVDVLGLRLGAAIACRYAAERRGQIGRLVLWDPVVRGAEFLASMRDQRTEFWKRIERLFGRAALEDEVDGRHDFVGFRFSETLVDELAQLDLLRTVEAPCRRALILDCAADASAAALQGRLVEMGVRAQLERRNAPKIWLAEPYQGLVPRESLDLVSSWVLEAQA